MIVGSVICKMKQKPKFNALITPCSMILQFWIFLFSFTFAPLVPISHFSAFSLTEKARHLYLALLLLIFTSSSTTSLFSGITMYTLSSAHLALLIIIKMSNIHHRHNLFYQSTNVLT